MVVPVKDQAIAERLINDIKQEYIPKSSKDKIANAASDESSKKDITKGTKIAPSRGSVEFDWPTLGGIITSYFGPRWGTNHNGIDIARVSDYTIKAADNGRIEFAGWRGTLKL